LQEEEAKKRKENAYRIGELRRSIAHNSAWKNMYDMKNILKKEKNKEQTQKLYWQVC